jgi:hypothetical protein
MNLCFRRLSLSRIVTSRDFVQPIPGEVEKLLRRF